MTRNDSKRSSTAPVQQKLIFSTLPTPKSDSNLVIAAAVTPGNNLAPSSPEPPGKPPAQTQESPITEETSAPANAWTSLRYRVTIDVKPDTTSKKTLLEVFSE